ncbi:MAG TPA: MFS transporter, partial [Chloroflexota bacterium]|nr:MFS transporter [Chloroflexota bacterium]
LINLVRDPPRGATEALSSQDDRAPLGRVLLQLLRVRTLATSILSQALSFFVLGGVSFWIPTYMSIHFQQNQARAGILSGAVIVVGGGFGTVAGGYLADMLLRRGIPSARLLVPAAGFLASAPFIAGALQSDRLVSFLILMCFATAMIQSSSGPLTALSQDVIVPARRARAVAISLLLTHLLGDAFAPFAIGGLSDVLGGLQQALLVASPLSVIIAAALGFYGCQFVGRDRERMLGEAEISTARSD